MTRSNAFAWLFLATFATLLTTVGVVNFVVNPYSFYPTRLYPPVSTNELEIVLRRLEDLQASPELVVLGSSRSMRIRPEIARCYSGLEAVNAAYSSATPEGFYGLAAYLVNIKQPAPKMFIIGLDVDAFHEQNVLADRVSNVPRLQRYLSTDSQLHARWLDFTSLISVGQFSDSLRVLRRENLSTVQDSFWGPALDVPLQLLGGEYVAPSQAGKQDNKLAKRAQVPRNQIALSAITRAMLKKFSTYESFSTKQQGYFELLLQLAQQRQIRVKVFITTLHPNLIRALDEQGIYPVRHEQVQQYLQELATRYPLEFYDFSVPANFGGNNKDFFNADHINEANSTRLAAALFKGDPAAARCDVDQFIVR